MTLDFKKLYLVGVHHMRTHKPLVVIIVLFGKDITWLTKFRTDTKNTGDALSYSLWVPSLALRITFYIRALKH
jgi:hypothetical protein